MVSTIKKNINKIMCLSKQLHCMKTCYPVFFPLHPPSFFFNNVHSVSPICPCWKHDALLRVRYIRHVCLYFTLILQCYVPTMSSSCHPTQQSLLQLKCQSLGETFPENSGQSQSCTLFYFTFIFSSRPCCSSPLTYFIQPSESKIMRSFSLVYLWNPRNFVRSKVGLINEQILASFSKQEIITGSVFH